MNYKKPRAGILSNMELALLCTLQETSLPQSTSDIIRFMHSRTGHESSNASVLAALKRMETLSYVTSVGKEWAESEYTKGPRSVVSWLIINPGRDAVIEHISWVLKIGKLFVSCQPEVAVQDDTASRRGTCPSQR